MRNSPSSLTFAFQVIQFNLIKHIRNDIIIFGTSVGPVATFFGGILPVMFTVIFSSIAFVGNPY